MASAMIIIGFVVFWFPIPVGALFMAFGFTILISRNSSFAAAVKRMRSRYARLDQFFLTLELRVPGAVRDKLKKTSPNQDRRSKA